MIKAREFATAVFRAVDDVNVQQFVHYMTSDCTFYFGNAEPVSGHVAITEYVQNFLSMIQQTFHDLSDVWEDDDFLICRLRVTYTRHDGKELSFPCVTVWKIKDNLISDYRIYIDNTPLFAT